MLKSKFNAFTILIFYGIFLGALPTLNAARILGVFPSATKSHLLTHCSVAEELARAGHNVTVIGITENIYPNSTYKHIHLKRKYGRQLDVKTIDDVLNGNLGVLGKIKSRLIQYNTAAKEMMENPKMQEFIRANNEGSFDLLLSGLTTSDIHLGLAAHFRCPIILSWVVRTCFITDRFLGNPSQPQYVPVYASKLKQPFDFMGRLNNFLLYLLEEYLKYTMDYESKKLYKMPKVFAPHINSGSSAPTTLKRLNSPAFLFMAFAYKKR